jgi:hypothetical protein
MKTKLIAALCSMFTLTFRAYWPDESIAGGKWAPPEITPVQ